MKLRYVFFFLIFFTSSEIEAKRNPYILPDPFGAYGVGFTEIECHDLRQNPFQSVSTRELKATVFYPSSDRTSFTPLGLEEQVLWTKLFEDQNVDPVTRFLNRNILPKGWELDSEALDKFKAELQKIESFRHKNAAHIADKKFPVLYFVPAPGMTPGGYLCLIQEIVSLGYVVVASHHPGISAVVHLSGDRLIYDQDAGDVTTILMDDLDFLMKLVPETEKLTRFCDFTKVAVMGHGAGGKAIQRSESDQMKNVKAKILLEDKTRNFSIDPKPTLYVFSNEVDKLHIAGLKSCLLDVDYRNMRLLEIPEFKANSFGDEQFVLNRLAQVVERPADAVDESIFQATYDKFTHVVCEFLGEYVK